MRMHNRTMFRKYVRNADIGSTAVNEIWHGDTMIYPDNETLVQKIQLVAPTVGTEEWAYWVHAVRGVTLNNNIYSKSAQVSFTLGAETWWCGDNRPTKLPSVTLTEAGLITFKTDEGMPAADLQAGDYLTIRAVIPKLCDSVHNSWVEDAWSKAEWGNPFLPNTYLYLRWGKGRKKQSANVAYNIYGYPSGARLIGGWCQATGHGRGDRQGWAFPWACQVGESWNGKSGDNIYIAGDTGITGQFQQKNGCYYMQAYIYYPAFTKDFRLKVKSVQTQTSGD